MFVALRDLRAARGRFLLITSVVVLVALLVSFLSGLTAGLAHQNIAAVQRIRGDAVVFADTGSSPSFDASALSTEQVREWQQSGGVVDPVGVGRVQATRAGGAPTLIAVFGVDGDAFGKPMATRPGTVVLSAPAANRLGAAAGDRVTIGPAEFTVAAVGGDDWYAHTPVVWTTLADWRTVLPRGGAATVLVVSGVPHPPTTGTRAIPVSDAPQAISSYQAEHTSLTLMTVLLFALSALVIGAFFVVWTIQRTPDIATLKALGATTGSLVRDALGQALLVLVLGVGLGVGVTAVAAGFLGDAVPFALTAATTLTPAAALIGLGLLGAAGAVRFLAAADPLTALNRNR
ncbi:ABC transporter permease [Nocardia sp. NPDC004068]|uniref:ABC transporter permease n=1 Tax=Nocardia sp. NPDC004068 TaxID=3364303 RepID=UPI003696854A